VVLVDTNVLLDLVTDDPNWSEWSLARLEEAALDGPVLINDVVYAETSIRYERIEDLDAMLADAMINIAPTATGTVPGWKGVSAIPRCGWRANRRPSRLLHRRPCGDRRMVAVDARCAPLSHIFS
jgi:predicted nucleic acid-binding protein